MKQLENSTICVDQSGTVGILSDGAVFYPFDADGNTSTGPVVDLATLKQATREQIPASRMLPDAVLDELGYAAAPEVKTFARSLDKAE